jgi:type IV secretion system protein VirB10
MDQPLNPQPGAPDEHVLTTPQKIDKPIKTTRIAFYMVLGICVVGLLSNIAHFTSGSATATSHSLHNKPSVTSLEALSNFQRQQAADALQLQKEREAAERLAESARQAMRSKDSLSSLPCDATLAGTQGTAPDGTPIVCAADGSWHPLRMGPNYTQQVPGEPGNAQDAAQQLRAEREKRLEEALASSTVAIDFTDITAREAHVQSENHPQSSAAASLPNPQALADTAPLATSAAAQAPSAAPTPSVTAAATQPPPVQAKYQWARYSGKLYRIFEGTVLETVLTNRVNGALAGPIDTMTTTDVWSHDHQKILIPQGTRCLGSVSAVNSTNQQRLFVSFHRCIMPDGFPLDLDRFTGLNQIGETALRDIVNNHYIQIFGTSLAVGAIAGMAQIGNSTNGLGYSPSTAIRNGVSHQTAEESLHILDHFLNQLPTFIVRERTRVKIYLSGDLEVPAYDAHRMDPTI